ncbi:Phosphoinositide phospholipase C [Mycena kentingensis (nom. inval.)]|nr:Phosphoinositide phospholipase C [Mycena kentingensis (nom. inval.)]
MSDQPSARRRIGTSIRRLGRRITRSKSPPPNRNSVADDLVPKSLQDGTVLTKISSKKQKKILVRLDAVRGQLAWDSTINKYIPVDAIRELRVGADTRTYRDQFQLIGQDYEDRWLTLVYIVDSSYKTLHLLGPSKEQMDMFVAALHKIYVARTELLDGLSPGERLDAVWERHYWNGRGFKLEDIQRLCKRLKVGLDAGDLRRLYEHADADNKGVLDLDSFRIFVKRLKARPDIERIYKKLASKHGQFDFAAFQCFMKDVQHSTLGVSQLEEVFEFYVEDVVSPPMATTQPGTMSPESFTSFLLSPDNPAFADPEEHSVAHKHHRHHRHYRHHHHRHNSFQGRDSHGVLAAKIPLFGEALQDMTRPLSEYFISSSHNTYLTGHQLVGESTVEGYIRALQAGCRCVEIDIHPGQPTPLVTHGGTLTSKLPLRVICEAINQYAFVASPYPLILSLEVVGCPPSQQDMIAEILTNVFGDKLIRAPVDGRPALETLPSPEDLRGMILVKTKNLLISSHSEHASSPTVEIAYTSADSTAEESEPISTPGGLMVPGDSRPPRLLQRASAAINRVRSRSRGHSISASTSTTTSDSSPPSSFVPLPPSTPPEQQAKPKMSFAMLALLVYTVGVKYRGINKKEEYAPEHMFSLSENSANKLIKSGASIDLIKHNRTHLIRIYPKGMRLRSSNYHPHHFWSAGAQLVAINWQTLDLGYMMNHAMFHRNGGIGYVLKPPALRLSGQKDLLSKRTNHILDLGIISAQQLPSPIKDKDGSNPDTFVEVSLHIPDWGGFHAQLNHTHNHSNNNSNGLHRRLSHSGRGAGLPASSSGTVSPPTSTASIIYRTASVKSNGFNPVYEEKLRIPFSCVAEMTDLIFVKFAVRMEGSTADDDPPLAVYCAPLSCLQHGYRHLPLHDSQLMQFMFSSLFVKVSIRDL